MILSIIVVADEPSNFEAEIEINSDDTFKSLNDAILDAAGYEKNEMTSFFTVNKDWERGQEITLVEMETRPDQDSYTMDKTRLEEFITEEGQNLIFVFDTLNDRYFYLNVKKQKKGSVAKPVCVSKKGKAPKQTDDSLLNEDLFKGLSIGKGTSSTDADILDGFSDDESYDDEDLSDLNVGEFGDEDK